MSVSFLELDSRQIQYAAGCWRHGRIRHFVDRAVCGQEQDRDKERGREVVEEHLCIVMSENFCCYHNENPEEYTLFM